MSKGILATITITAGLAFPDCTWAQQHTGKTDKQIVEDTRRNSEEARRARDEAVKQAARDKREAEMRAEKLAEQLRMQERLAAEARDKAVAEAAWREKQRKLEAEKQKR